MSFVPAFFDYLTTHFQQDERQRMLSSLAVSVAPELWVSLESAALLDINRERFGLQERLDERSNVPRWLIAAERYKVDLWEFEAAVLEEQVRDARLEVPVQAALSAPVEAPVALVAPVEIPVAVRAEPVVLAPVVLEVPPPQLDVPVLLPTGSTRRGAIGIHRVQGDSQQQERLPENQGNPLRPNENHPADRLQRQR